MNRGYEPMGKSFSAGGVGWTLNQRVQGSTPCAPTTKSRTNQNHCWTGASAGEIWKPSCTHLCTHFREMASGAPKSTPLNVGKKLKTLDRLHLFQRHALLGQFLFCLLVLGQVHQAHATQHIGRLGELDILIADDLDSIAPRIPKIKEGAIN